MGRHGVRHTDGTSKRRAAVPFADIVHDVLASPVRFEDLRPGHYGDMFVDEDGQIYRLVADDIDSPSAQRLATAGARVVWDACGCGGGCSGLRQMKDDEVERMVRSGPPTIRRTRRRHGRIRHLRAADGASMLMVEAAVSWGDVLG